MIHAWFPDGTTRAPLRVVFLDAGDAVEINIEAIQERLDREDMERALNPPGS